MGNLRTSRPQLSVSDASRIAGSLYGLTECVRELPSERDRNFLFRGSDGNLFTLKIANSHEDRDAIDFQNQAMAHVGDGVRAVPSRNARLIENADEHLVRLVTFVPGVPLAEFRPHTSELLRNLGRLLGETDRKLDSFKHQASRRELYWDIRNAERIISEYKSLIRDSRKRAIVEDVLLRWKLPNVRTSVIHNDANDYNVIVNDEDQIALIDYGDMLETFTVAEPAIACAYIMLGKPDPLAAAADVIRGYHEKNPLDETEIDILYGLIRGRLAMSVTIAAHQKELEPENDYLSISEKPAWELLEKLAGIPPQFPHYVFRDACGLPACPRTSSIVRFLKSEDTSFARVVDVDLSNPASKDAVVFDLSIGSLELGTFDEAADVARITTQLFRRLEDAGAKVGVGRYNEPRGLYTSPLFATESNDGLEWRTVHLGIDLFMRAGSPIQAPLDGVVHAFRNNDAPLDYGPTIVLRHTTTDGIDFFTLYGHLSVDSLDGLAAGRPVRRGEQIARIGTYPTNGGWPPHLHFQVIADTLDRDGEFPGVAAASQRSVWLSLSPDPNLILGIPAEKFPEDPPTAEETLQERRNRIGPNLSLSYNTPLKIVRGSGCYLFDDVGRGYLDCVNNVAHVGHSHPRVVRAAQRQLAVLNTNTRYLHDNIVEYARRLTAKLPPALSVCYFVNSGSEANDLALRLARAHIGSHDTIVMESAYHGNLTSLIDISPYKFDGPGGMGAAPHVNKVRLADPLRGNYSVEDVRHAVRGPATLIMESLLSCGGQIVLPDGYLGEVYKYVRTAGGVCIADEVQVGFGRVGTHFWGFETQNVIPDIVTAGKSIGNGHPIGAVITTREIAASFNNGMEYFNTFGGNPVSCAVGTAVLDVIEGDELQKHAHDVGDFLIGRLRELQRKHSLIGDVRGLGLFIGIELVRDIRSLQPAPAETSYIVERMKARGILLSVDGPLHNVIKIKPPLPFSRADAERLISSLDVVLNERHKIDAIARNNRF